MIASLRFVIQYDCFLYCLQCFDTVGWVAGRASGPQKIWGNDGGGHWLVRMEWRPAGWSVCLPLLISPYAIKSRSSLLAPADPGGPGKRAAKQLWCDGGGAYNFIQEFHSLQCITTCL